MKTKLAFLVTALAVASMGTIATAGPDLQTMELRKKIADANRSTTVVRDTGYGVTYVPSPSGKGHIVAKQDAGSGATNIALFKSHKKDACCEKR
jgi:hypothetical protein